MSALAVALILGWAIVTAYVAANLSTSTAIVVSAAAGLIFWAEYRDLRPPPD